MARPTFPRWLTDAVITGLTEGFRERSIAKALKIIKETKDVNQLPEMLASNEPAIHEAAKRKLIDLNTVQTIHDRKIKEG